MGKPKLGYWNLRGLAQSIKFCVEYMGVEYEDVIYDNNNPSGEEQWLKEKPTMGMEAPNLPYWIDDKIKISESKAIMKYLIRKHQPSLLPTDINVLVKSDQIEGIVGDIAQALAMDVYLGTDSATGWFELSTPVKLECLSKFLGEGKFFLGNEPSFVDFLAYEILWRLKTHRSKFMIHDNLNKYVDEFEKLPKIAAYIKSQRFIESPCYGSKAVNRI